MANLEKNNKDIFLVLQNFLFCIFFIKMPHTSLYLLAPLILLISVSECKIKNCWNGTARFHADDCDDDFSGACSVTFPPPSPLPPEDQPPQRAAACRDPALRTEALQCAKSCFICCERPEYNCDNPESSASFDCVGMQASGLCNVANLKDIMIEKCPQTCGFCHLRKNADGTPVVDCVDTLDECEQADFKALCEDVAVGEKMKELRYKFPEKDCRDEGENCQENIRLCENLYFLSLMKENCRKTCAYCRSPDFSCKDKNSADCATWNANGFCSSTWYPKGTKLQYCADTCKLC
ncbi:shK domain-like domain-containing protein [Ditylenchus destructor]|uniref:ShK domain-like domain-containing protein n=1 Tax=Ditylenchus destructor TaxID=166010 RepID=A0AAD4R2D8_9BILA|nr:shK domain-like domain-containing protein [Ditylenchus destructor]